MKIATTAGRVVLFAALCAVLAIPASSLAQGALDQLEDGTNTGTLFDGSDGNRFGTDTEIGGSSGNVPDASGPTPVDTPDDGGDQGDEGDQGDQGESEDSGNDDSGKDGEEPAE